MRAARSWRASISGSRVRATGRCGRGRARLGRSPAGAWRTRPGGAGTRRSSWPAAGRTCVTCAPTAPRAPSGEDRVASPTRSTSAALREEGIVANYASLLALRLVIESDDEISAELGHYL